MGAPPGAGTGAAAGDSRRAPQQCRPHLKALAVDHGHDGAGIADRRPRLQRSDAFDAAPVLHRADLAAKLRRLCALHGLPGAGAALGRSRTGRQSCRPAPRVPAPPPRPPPPPAASPPSGRLLWAPSPWRPPSINPSCPLVPPVPQRSGAGFVVYLARPYSSRAP